MNTQQTIDCYHLTVMGIKKVSARRQMLNLYSLFATVEEARLALADCGKPQKPRVAPRMSTASPSVAAA